MFLGSAETPRSGGLAMTSRSRRLQEFNSVSIHTEVCIPYEESIWSVGAGGEAGSSTAGWMMGDVADVVLVQVGSALSDQRRKLS